MTSVALRDRKDDYFTLALSDSFRYHQFLSANFPLKFLICKVRQDPDVLHLSQALVEIALISTSV